MSRPTCLALVIDELAPYNLGSRSCLLAALRSRQNVFGGCSNRCSEETIVHHLTIVIEPEESPDSNVIASDQLGLREHEDQEVPQQIYQEDVLDGFTDWHD